jgi:heme exporter protein D
VLLYAHVGHQLIWLLYAVPILIVAAAIVRSMRAQRRLGDDEEERA